MKIINVIKSTNGIVENVESFVIIEWLSNTDNRFFKEKDAIEKAENLFKELLLKHNAILEEDLDKYLDDGYIEFVDHKRHETIELYIIWSGINVNE